jgi:hypothetical protein
MTCNIDARGRAIRLISGIVVTLIGVVLLALWLAGTLEPWWVAAIAVVTLASGLFQVYEGWAGWCVLRALGWQTPV